MKDCWSGICFAKDGVLMSADLPGLVAAVQIHGCRALWNLATARRCMAVGICHTAHTAEKSQISKCIQKLVLGTMSNLWGSYGQPPSRACFSLPLVPQLPTLPLWFVFSILIVKVFSGATLPTSQQTRSHREEPEISGNRAFKGLPPEAVSARLAQSTKGYTDSQDHNTGWWPRLWARIRTF